jgi:hypothetical protein
MSSIELSVTRAAASTFLTSDLSVDAADATVIIDALYGGASGTPTRRFQDSRALRSLCEGRIGSANTITFFGMMAIDY